MAWITEHLELIISLITILVASIASLAGISVKWRSDKKALEIENIRLETKQKELEKAIIDGSYIICPNCGSKIFLKDVDIKTKGVNE